ncbi:hypothetical protein BDZ89DRAFT_1209161, partial [Hymenopellis radicata]
PKRVPTSNAHHRGQTLTASSTPFSLPSTATSTLFSLTSLSSAADAFMATPSSSATSPSPPMAYIPHASTPSQPTPSPTIERFDRDNKKKAVQKLIARAELSNVTRSLRNRLNYASHKTPALSRYIAPRDGEMLAQGSNPAMQFARSNTARRKPPANTTSFHGAGPSHGMGGMPNANSPLRRGASGPSNSASGLGSRHTFSNEPTRYSLGGQTLFTSILAPPPPQQARTILNAGDPPIAAPLRPEPSPREHGASVIRSIAEGTRAHSKSRRTDASPSRRKGKARASKPSRPNDQVDADGDVDMKAAKTLTSLLLQHRPSIAGASSPRSSFDGSDAGSTQSYPIYPQGSAARGFPNPPPSQGGPSTSTSFREMTPPDTAPSQHQTTPRPAPTDNEAADLMLFLATSPSPARPSKDANNSRDQAAYRALGGQAAVVCEPRAGSCFPPRPVIQTPVTGSTIVGPVLLLLAVAKALLRLAYQV